MHLFDTSLSYLCPARTALGQWMYNAHNDLVLGGYKDGLVRSLAVLVALLHGLHVILVCIIVAISGLEEVAVPEL